MFVKLGDGCTCETALTKNKYSISTYLSDVAEEALADALAPHGGAHVQVLEHHGAALPRGIGGEEQRVAHHDGGARVLGLRRRQLGHGAAERRRRRLEPVTLQLCRDANALYQRVFKANINSSTTEK